MLGVKGIVYSWITVVKRPLRGEGTGQCLRKQMRYEEFIFKETFSSEERNR